MPKIAFPVEEGFIRLQPSIAAEIGLNAAIVLLYLIFILEGNTKYLEWDAETKSYWLKKSYNTMSADLFPYFKLTLVEDKSTGRIVEKSVSFETVKHTVRKALDYLCDELEMIHRKRVDLPGNSGRVYYYSLNYKMLELLNGLSVKWDHSSDMLRIGQFVKNSVRQPHTPKTPNSCATEPNSCATEPDSCATGRTHNTENRKKKINIENDRTIFEFSEIKIEKRSQPELSPEALQLLEEINAL